MTNLNKFYGEYLAAKTIAKGKVKDFIKSETLTERIALGKEIVSMRDSGLTVTQIAASLGQVGRVFVYDCINAYNETLVEQGGIIPTDSEPGEIDYDIQHTPADESLSGVEEFGIRLYQNGRGVSDYILMKDNNGDLIIPDEWATHSPQLRAVYKRVIAEIEG